jgi:hypothetical protein
MDDAAHAKVNLEHALTISRELAIPELEAKSLLNLARFYKYEHDLQSALQYAQDAREIFKSLDAPEFEKTKQFIEGVIE